MSLCCESGRLNKATVLIIAGNFFTSQERLGSEEGLCSMVLLIYLFIYLFI